MAKLPPFAKPKPPAPSRSPRRWLWLLVPLLLATLLLQIVLADRARLATDPLWRPRVLALCELLRCTVAPWHEPAALVLTSREVRPHPTAAGVLQVTATFRNDARFAQPWPLLQLSLVNVDGEALGLRRFGPSEYLGQEPTSALIAPGQSATLSLAIVDPGKRAVEFSFQFL